MSDAVDVSPEAIRRRAEIHEHELRADGMLRRAAGLERRAARARVGSNERTKLEARTGFLRACAQQLRQEISELAREETARAESRIAKLEAAGRRGAQRARG